MQCLKILARLRWFALVMAAALSACGGGGGGGTSTTLPLMVDSFGQAVAEADFGGGDAGASGGDGTAGDGAGFPNAPVRVTDSTGRVATAQTNAQGYYRVRLDGFTPPFVASVTRSNGQVLYSPAVTPVKVRGFVTINITGLTDKIASDVAVAAGRSGATEITPAIIAANASALQLAKASLNSALAVQIASAGLPSTFDPVTLAFKPDLTGYDKVLESVIVTRTASGATVITPKYSVGGTVSGLGARTGLTLGNGTETISVSANATSFVFASTLVSNAAYGVSIRTQPTGATCSVSNGAGTVPGNNVSNVSVVCSGASFTLGGSISGLGNATGLVLASGGQAVAIAANAASFVFSTPVAQGAAYAVTVQTQPSSGSCSVTGGSGTMGAGNVTTVQVTCSLNTFTLGGSVSGLTGSGLVLAGGGQTVAIASGASSFVFPSPFAAGSTPNVSVQTQPTGQSCTVGSSSAAGTVSSTVNNSVTVTCSGTAFPVSGSINGLTGSGLSLTLGAQTVVLSPGAASFSFPTSVASGAAYNVTVSSQPSGQSCSVTNGAGTMGSAAVTNVTVTCSSTGFSLGGTISGLAASGLVLASNGQTTSPAANSTTFVFPSALPAGTNYSVTVQTQPAGQFCSVSNGSGTINSSVSNVAVSCVSTYTLSSAFSGLTGSGLVLANGGQTLAVSANATSATFATPFPRGSTVNMTVQTQPTGQTCTVLDNGSSINTSNASAVNLSVSCTAQPTVTTPVSPQSFAPSGIAVGPQAASLLWTSAGANGVYQQVINQIVCITSPCPSGSASNSQFGGSGVAGSANGIGTNASFNQPRGIAVDSAGNVFVADMGNNKIRKWTASSGAWSDFAGSGVDGFADGSGAGATFGSPSGLAMDSSSTLYVTSNGRCACVRKVTSAGVVTTRSTTWLNGFREIAVSSAGTVYATTTANELVSVDMSSGAVAYVNTSATVFTGGIAVDSSGAIFAADLSAHKIYRLVPSATLGGIPPAVYAGTGAAGSSDGPAATATFNGPLPMAFGPSGGNYSGIFVGETVGNRIRNVR